MRRLSDALVISILAVFFDCDVAHHVGGIGAELAAELRHGLEISLVARRQHEPIANRGLRSLDIPRGVLESELAAYSTRGSGDEDDRVG